MICFPSFFLKITWTIVLVLVMVCNFAGAQSPSFYEPIEQNIEGWKVKLDPELLKAENKAVSQKAFDALKNHLQRVKFIVPQKRLAELQSLPIWMELENAKLNNMQYHPSRGWLKSNGHDPRLEKHVHLPQARELYARHMWAKHPYVVLHELAHAYHDQVLGFDDHEIRKAFRRAKKSGTYDDILFHTGRTGKHYGMNNEKEYFAESTEAYFGVNDFYPFVRAELKKHDPGMYELLKKIWGKIE